MARRTTVYGILVIATICLFFFTMIMAVLLGGSGGRQATGERFDLGWSSGVGLVEIDGFIGASERTVKLIDEFASRSNIKALLVRINSPGGVTVPADEIYRALKRARTEEFKPVVAYLSSVAASGGYYIACAADTIVAHPSSMTGSIGVIVEYPVAAELMEKLGVRWETVTTGPYKNMGSPFEEPTERHLAWFQEVVDDTYEQFLEVVRDNREIEEDDLRRYADGRVFTGRQAAQWGFADRTGDFRDARALAGRMAGLGEEPTLIRPRAVRQTTVLDYLLGRAHVIDEIRKELGLGPFYGARIMYLMR